MTAEQQEDHQKVKFDTLREAFYHRVKCPLCTANLIERSLRNLRNDPNYSLVVRNDSDTKDILRVHKDHKTVDVLIETALHGKNGLFHVSFSLTCEHCNSYRHVLRTVIDLKNKVIVESLLVSISIRLSYEENLVLRTFYEPPRSELVIEDKVYKIDFVDFDPSKSKELYERFSCFVPFI